jgi:hypothetical protein
MCPKNGTLHRGLGTCNRLNEMASKTPNYMFTFNKPNQGSGNLCHLLSFRTVLEYSFTSNGVAFRSPIQHFTVSHV